MPMTGDVHTAGAAGPSLPPYLDVQDEALARRTTLRGAMGMVLGPEGLVLHLRDDKSWIPHPGCWSFFGGGLEPGELAEDAVRRELMEELGLRPLSVRALWRVVDDEGDGRVLVIFEVRTDTVTDDMRLGEGRALRAFTMADALRLRLAPFCRRSLTRYAAHAGIDVVGG